MHMKKPFKTEQFDSLSAVFFYYTNVYISILLHLTIQNLIDTRCI